MIKESDIRWSNYSVYEGPFYIGASKFKLPAEPSFEDKILAVITATEGGSWNAINMYDRCICTVGLIQWCEGGQFSVSDMLGVVHDRDANLLSPLAPVMNEHDVLFSKTARGKWRFHFMRDKVNEIDTAEEQKKLFLLNSNGTKGSWDKDSIAHAKRWAAAMASVFEQPEAIHAQRDFTVPRLMSFALPQARALINMKPSSVVGQAFTCAYLSFAANNPKRAADSLAAAQSSWKGEILNLPWLVHVLEKLTFHSGVTIYPHRYNAIRPVLERLFAIDLPDHSAALQGLLTPAQIQDILAHKLGYELGNSGPNHDGVDGAWGGKSRAALADFQRRNGLIVDGEPDPETNATLLRAA